MLASGARGRLADILMSGSCGEGGMNTVAAIHNNMHQSLALRCSKLEASKARGAEDNALRTRAYYAGGEAR